MRIIKTFVTLSILYLVAISNISFGMFGCFCCGKKVETRENISEKSATKFFQMTREEQDRTEIKLEESLYEIFEQTEDIQSGGLFQQKLERELGNIYEYTEEDFSRMNISTNKKMLRKMAGLVNLKLILTIKKSGFYKDNPPPPSEGLEIFRTATETLRKMEAAKRKLETE